MPTISRSRSRSKRRSSMKSKRRSSMKRRSPMKSKKRSSMKSKKRSPMKSKRRSPMKRRKSKRRSPMKRRKSKRRSPSKKHNKKHRKSIRHRKNKQVQVPAISLRIKELPYIDPFQNTLPAGTTIEYPDLSQNVLVNKDLRALIIHGATFKNKQLFDTRLEGTKFIDCQFINTNFDGAIIDKNTEFIDCMFKHCKTDNIKYVNEANKEQFANVFQNM